jgi:hypothetical protein
MVNEYAKENLELLCNINIFLGLAYIILMLKCVQNISKLIETYEVFICDFVVVMKKCEGFLLNELQGASRV